MEGNESNHLRYRKEICDFMRKNRIDYEPFIVGLYDELNEDNKNKKKFKETSTTTNNSLNDKFEAYIKNLEQSGIYGGNDCLVTFSRLYNIEINIHQLNQPIWKINSTDRPIGTLKQLHLSYHNGDHYSSIRRLGDETNTPTNIMIGGIAPTQQEINDKTKKSYNYASNYDYEENNESIEDNDINDNIERIMNITNCFDLNLIKQTLNDNNNDLDSSVSSIMNKLILNEVEEVEVNEQDDNNINNNNKTMTKSNKKLSAREKKYEKKQRQMERQRQKVIDEKEKTQVSKVLTESSAEEQVQIKSNNEQLNILNVSATNI